MKWCGLLRLFIMFWLWAIFVRHLSFINWCHTDRSYQFPSTPNFHPLPSLQYVALLIQPILSVLSFSFVNDIFPLSCLFVLYERKFKYNACITKCMFSALLRTASFLFSFTLNTLVILRMTIKKQGSSKHSFKKLRHVTSLVNWFVTLMWPLLEFCWILKCGSGWEF